MAYVGVKNTNEGLKDKLVTNQGMELPIGKLFTYGKMNEYADEFKGMSDNDILRLVKYIENIDEYIKGVDEYLRKTDLGVDKPLLDKKMRLLRRLYSMNVQNIDRLLQLVNDPPSYYNNLMKLQATLKKVDDKLNEDLEYNHVDDATQDKFMIGESFRYNDLSYEEKNAMYNVFRDSYIKATGSAWDESKFNRRAYNWEFFGNSSGFVAVRPQKGGLYKLVGVGGEKSGIIKGMIEKK